MRLDKRWWLLVGLLGLLAIFFGFDLGRFLSLAAIKSSQADLQAWREGQPVLAGLLFFAGYVAVAALSVPGAAVMTLAAGALFGLGWGTLIVSFASSIGATLAFLAARWLLGGWVQSRFGDRLAALNAGIAKEGGFYLFTLRLVPVFPFFLVNLVPAFLGVPLRTYVLGTFIGIIPGSLVYAGVGSGLGTVFEAGGTPDLGIIFRPEIILPIIGLAVLALLPVAYRRFKGRNRTAGQR
jgi:uncharacterized membrane protein YdjX (TVP38/TMEM64 family)